MINVIGLGYIGLPTALMLAAHFEQMQIVGTDCDTQLIEQLKSGKMDFKEEGMEALFNAAQSKQIEFTTIYMKAEFYIVAVPTPYKKTDKKIDPSFVVDAVRQILEICEENATIIIESTVSPKTIDHYIRPLICGDSAKIRKMIKLAHAPERIIPGRIIYELEHNSRTIGADDSDTGERVRAIYESFCQGEIVLTDIRTAEMTKVVENTYRDINIAFANELAKICRSDHMDVYEIIKIANKHPRVNILSPGPGVGGHCISVDPWFLVGDYPGLSNIILAARKINDSMPEFVLERMREIMKCEGLSDLSRVGLYGLTYKEEVDDVRESPALQLLDCMDRHLAHGIKSYDPFVKRKIVEGQFFDFDEFLSNIDFIVIMVGHKEICENKKKIEKRVVLDTRNICDFNVYKL